MEKVFFDQLLFDYYGTCLTSKQQEVLKLYYNEDLGLSEIADIFHTTRQSIYDLIKRTHLKLKSFEQKLGFIKNGLRRQKELEELQSLVNSYSDQVSENETLTQIKNLVTQLIKQEEE